MPALARSRKAIVLALGLAMAAVLLQWLLRPLVGARVPFLFFFPAVGVAAMWLGARAGALVLAVGFFNALYWLEPVGSIQVGNPADRISVAAYLLGAGVLVALGARFHELRSRALVAEGVLAGQVRDLQALQELGNRVLSITGIEAQLQAILGTLCRLLGAERGVVTLVEADSGAAHLVVSLGVGEERSFATVRRRPLVNMRGEAFGELTLHFVHERQATDRDEQVADLCAQMASVLAERELLVADALQLSRQVEVALESSAVPFCLIQPVRDAGGALQDFRWEYLNGAARKALGVAGDDFAGRPVRATFPAAWVEPGLVEQLDEALSTGTTRDFEMQVQGYAKKPWFRVIVSPCEGGLAIWFSNVSQRREQEEALREADRRKDEFLATLAHELRNPLAPIRQATVIARSPLAKPEQQRWGLEVIDRQVAHMAVLLDDLLDVSRITRGRLELRRVPTDLRQVIDAALEAARPAIEARGQRLEVHGPGKAIWADVDLMRMSQVVGNLLTNACKYTPADGTIRLDAYVDGSDAVISVKDTGIGIPAESLESVFEMFTQLRTPGSQATVGLGIGLALARGLAQMHGATLVAASEGPGRGSTFTLRVPMCEAPGHAAPVGRHDGGTVRMRRVLVADDNRDAAESLAQVLRMQGHDVALAFDGHTALARFRELHPQVVLLDIGMPLMTGYEVAAAIRKLPEGTDTVLVAITGWGQERDRLNAREAGFDHHFTKPVDPMALLELVGAAAPQASPAR